MRDILFRGKRKDTGEWVRGSLIHRTEFYGDPCDDFLILTDGEFHLDFYTAEEVLPATVGQFTGLTDKNGKKIFEGDVCRFYGDEGYSDYAVFWDDTTSQWTVRQIDLGARDVLDSYFAECCEVIGNIHDNPELLEGE